MSRPRLLYVPITAAREAERFAAQADWADVASFDAPGAGANRDLAPHGVAGVVEAARARLDELAWETCGVVCESHGQAAAIELALTEPDRVKGIFIGHAAARYAVTGPRPAMSPSVRDVAGQLLETDYRAFARAITQMTQGQMDDAYVDAWAADVPQPVAQDLFGELSEEQPGLVSRLAGSDLVIVLGEHRGCLMWTPEAFADACEAVPEARAVSCDGIPTEDPSFLDAVRTALT